MTSLFRLRHIPRMRSFLAVFTAILTQGVFTLSAQAGADFASVAEAEAFLREELPKITAANPHYITKADGTDTQWLTKAIAFDGPRVKMDEVFLQKKKGAAEVATNTHRAEFSLKDVRLEDIPDFGDVTPSGEMAKGVLFQCVRPGCVMSAWNGVAQMADHTDISIQDEASRVKIRAAFAYLKRAAER